MRYIGVLMVVLSLIPCQAFAKNQDVEAKIRELAGGLSDLQQQIKELKAELKDDASISNNDRIANLEAYAVQLHDVLTEVQQQVSETNTTIERVSDAQDKQPHLGMYGSIAAGKTSGENSVIDGQSFELILSGQPHERLSYFAEIEFERAAEVGGKRGGNILLEQAYTDFSINTSLNVRGGILLVPFGNIERDHYSPLREVISTPLTSYALAPSDWTDNGFGVNGKYNLPDDWVADYQLYVIAGLDSNISSVGMRDARQGFGEDNNSNKAVTGKVSFQNSEGQTIGFSLYRGAWDDSSNHFITGINMDFDYRWKWLDFTGEATRMMIEREGNGQAYMDGFYVRSIASIDYFMPDNWLSSDLPHAELQLVAQYDQANIENVFDPGAKDNWEKRVTLGVRVLPLSEWILNFNYEYSKAGGPDTILRGNANTWLMSMGFVF